MSTTPAWRLRAGGLAGVATEPSRRATRRHRDLAAPPPDRGGHTPRPHVESATETDTRSFELRCDRDAPAVIREAVRELEEIGWAVGDAMLVASELVSNAVVHSGAREHDIIRVELALHGDRLLISVIDPGISGVNAVRAATEDPFGGIGLRLVEQLAIRWGSERRDGYRVWAELALPKPGSAPPTAV